MAKQDETKDQSLRAMMAYGFADIYGGGAFVVISTFFTAFLTKASGMPVLTAGTIPLIGKVWDAITDPIMGNITDRTRSKFGPKRFWMLIGAWLSAITFILLWVPARIPGKMGMYLFYCLTYMLFSTGFTIVMVPYNALLPDMEEDYTARSKFSAVRMAFSTFGAILAGLIPTILITDNTNANQYFHVALIFGVLFTIVILITFAGTWEQSHEPVKATLGETFTQSFTVYKSRSFRLFLAIFICGQGAADFVTGLAVYYIDDVLNAYGGGRFTMLMGDILLAQFAGTLLFGYLMTKTSKKFPIYLGFPIRIVATLAILAFSYEGANFTIILALSFIIGLGMAASSTSIYAILPDMADVDELITSINRPGTCSGMATFIRKIATGLSSMLIGLLLSWVGYNENLASMRMRQTISTQRGIALIYVFVPIILMGLTNFFAILFPVNRKEFDVIKKEIARRKGEDSSQATDEEKRICQEVTGYAYDRLWKKENALKFRNR
jgi:oligogalacturonide transporter